MTSKNPHRKLIIFLFIIAAVVIGGSVYYFKQMPSKSNVSEVIDSGQDQSAPSITQSNVVETDYFSYQKPTGWENLSADFLKSEDSTTGIGTTPSASVKFTTAMQSTSTSPSTDKSIKDATVSTLSKLPNFLLISSGNAKLDSKSAQEFLYTYGAQTNIKQKLIIVTYKDNVYLAKFSGLETDFDKSSIEFDSILGSFKFK